ncbi:MAG: CinA family protein [Eubacteriales bacterium]
MENETTVKIKASAARLVGRLLEKNKKISTAESCTGGLISYAITSVPGASGVFETGICAYSNRIKETVLGVKNQTLENFGAVSGETAIEMAEGVKLLAGADYAVAVSGIAGPGGGSEEKPVGTVWLAFAYPGGAFSKLCRFEGNRDEIRLSSALCALEILNRITDFDGEFYEKT